jgi:hypothetical protein
VWTSSLPYYLSGDGIHFNPAMDPGLDCAMGRTPLMVPAVAFEITWEVEFGLLPAPFPGQMPCYGLAGRGIGLGMTNEIIDPAFNIYEPNMPATPNWGPAPIIYDAKSWGPGIVVTMGFADYSPNMCNDQIWVKGNCPEDVGCYDPQYYTNTHFKIKAMCPGAGSGGGGRTRLTRGRVPRNG